MAYRVVPRVWRVLAFLAGTRPFATLVRSLAR